MKLQQAAESLPKGERCCNATLELVHMLQPGIVPHQSRSILLAWSDQWKLHRPELFNIVNPEARLA